MRASTPVHRPSPLFASPDQTPLTDGQLLERFLAECDEAAFAELVRRHGPMVLGAALRILHNLHDAEDVFQATFLLLARKGASVKPREQVGNWLYGVSVRTALEAKTIAARRRAMEGRIGPRPPSPPPDETDFELRRFLDEELKRLPAMYRTAVVLCELEGRSRKEVARELGVPEGTLSSRLATARKLLAQRLAGRGLMLSVESLTVALFTVAAPASVPAELLHTTVTCAVTGATSAAVAALIEGAKYTMWIKLAVSAVIVLGLSVMGGGAGVLSYRMIGHGKADKALAVAQKLDSPVNTQLQDEKKDQQDDKEQNQKDDGQKNQKDDGQKNQKDDGQKGQNDDQNKNEKDATDAEAIKQNVTAKKVPLAEVKKEQKDEKEQNNKDDGQKNQKDDGQKNDKDDGQKGQKDDKDQNEKGEKDAKSATSLKQNVTADKVRFASKKVQKDNQDQNGKNENDGQNNNDDSQKNQKDDKDKNNKDDGQKNENQDEK